MVPSWKKENWTDNFDHSVQSETLFCTFCEWLLFKIVIMNISKTIFLKFIKHKLFYFLATYFHFYCRSKDTSLYDTSNSLLLFLDLAQKWYYIIMWKENVKRETYFFFCKLKHEVNDFGKYGTKNVKQLQL